MKKNKFFSIIADEVTDSACKEQLSMVLRDVDPDDYVREDLVDFLECDTGVTGRIVAEKITNRITGYGLDINNFRGQAYDEAGNMAGSSKGAAAFIKETNPWALYQHCSSHALNLAVVKSIQITSVRNMMGTVDRISTFMEGHPKRAYAFEAAVLETQLESRKHKLKNLCCTRWVERLDALATFVELHPTVVACLEKIVEDGPAIWSTDSLTDAQTLLLAITSTDFIVSLVITNNALGYLKGVTTSLQAEAKDIVEAISEVNYLKAALQDVRNNMDDH
ncbi:zinc finger MYM-type protein 1-like [Homarus americanus]|uniref:zinc finger MYM-type protein 1-like n=1 Tax=Homarus americanus TaxID=6706 RepID=UPI001C43C805|nr:zinc finger MYM-type protein 1-like [Homarus americanus]